MKILVCGDIHMSTSRLGSLAAAAEADLLVLNGDLTNYGGVKELRQVLDEVMGINPRLLAQYGNLDRPEVNDYLQELGINIHGQARVVGDEVCIIGLGGSNFTPFHTPSEFSETALIELGRKGFRQGARFTELAESLYSRVIPTIFISHAPPAGSGVDTLRSGRQVGSPGIRSIIEHYRPDLCVCGHIHEARGIGRIGDTPVYNPGMLREGGCVEITIEKSQIQVHLQ